MHQERGITAEEQTRLVGGVTLRLSRPYDSPTVWIGADLAARQLRAAWMRLTPEDQPMNPRLVGKPGVGKTTLAVAVGQSLQLPVYLMQATADTRPEDLIVTPVIAENRQISYVASPLVTAMLTGGIAVLDEGNRMSEKSWASLAALLDHRRYVDSVVAGVRIEAHPEFRFVTTMNDDSSVYDLPEYIQSRLNPQIFLDFADAESERRIVKLAVPYAESDLLELLVGFLAASHASNEPFSVRDGIQIAKFASRLRSQDKTLPVPMALLKAIEVVLGPEVARRLVPPDGSPGRSRLRPL